jgi:hypothetical protein
MAAEAPAGGGDSHMCEHGGGSSPPSAEAWQAGAALGLSLGPPDCELVGPGWSLQAHKHVLKSE